MPFTILILIGLLICIYAKFTITTFEPERKREMRFFTVKELECSSYPAAKFAVFFMDDCFLSSSDLHLPCPCGMTQTPLHISARLGKADIVQQLQQGDFNAATTSGIISLSTCAGMRGTQDAVRLFDHGASLS